MPEVQFAISAEQAAAVVRVVDVYVLLGMSAPSNEGILLQQAIMLLRGVARRDFVCALTPPEGAVVKPPVRPIAKSEAVSEVKPLAEPVKPDPKAPKTNGAHAGQ